MQTLQVLERKRKSAQDLQSIVKTMKTLAAVNIRHYERAVQAVAAYYRTVELGLHIVLRDGLTETLTARLPRDEKWGAIVFGTDQGLCGSFNEQVAAYAIDKMNGLHVRKENWVLATVGARTTARLEEANRPVETVLAVPGSLAGITPTVQDLELKLDAWRARGVERIVLLHNRLIAPAGYEPHLVHLLPVDAKHLAHLRAEKWQTHVLPMFTMDRERLFSALIHQYIFAVLYRALAESLAGENASRLLAMQSAEKNIQDHLWDLELRLHHQRQSAITGELLDIVAGMEAMETSAIGSS